MPFPESVRIEALTLSDRHCCVCKQFAGRDGVVHHIVQESLGGPNTLDNAIFLCSRCHGEAGHYNPLHPLGTKYSPDELRLSRDHFWAYRAANYAPEATPPGFREPVNSGRGVPIHRKRVGVLWSHRADIPRREEIIEFEGRLLASFDTEDQTRVASHELYGLPDGRFLVYSQGNNRGDWGDAIVHGAPCFDEPDSPLSLAEIHERFPALASRAGLARIRRV